MAIELTNPVGGFGDIPPDLWMAYRAARRRRLARIAGVDDPGPEEPVPVDVQVSKAVAYAVLRVNPDLYQVSKAVAFVVLNQE